MSSTAPSSQQPQQLQLAHRGRGLPRQRLLVRDEPGVQRAVPEVGGDVVDTLLGSRAATPRTVEGALVL